MKLRTNETAIKNMTFRHYGTNVYDPDLVNQIANEPYSVKPTGGFWLSPTAKCFYRWIDFLKDEVWLLDTHDVYIDFKIKKESRVLILDSLEALNAQPTITYENFIMSTYLDFEKISKEYDAIFYEERLMELRWALYGWDVTSLLILNKNILEEI